MKVLKLNIYNEVWGKTVTFINLDNVKKFTYNFKEDEDYIYLQADDHYFEGVCTTFDIVQFCVFLECEDEKSFFVDIVNHKLYVHEKGNKFV